ncbi:MAG TPA: malto-oligosyltrehalose synthase [Chloroflexota bacterium]|nr:malto-oligosyltrehalose synthase [Chloroflexota bacterium]
MAVTPVATVPTTKDLLEVLASWPRPRIPAATYRLQFHAGFTFRDARRLVPYLHDLGVTDVYASPYLKARAGSAHGYDVANPNALNPEIGTEDDYRALVEELASHGMGQVLDTVPNHMGIGDVNNVWWQDVLENGPSSVYADFFDIDWSPAGADIQDSDKVVLPILGDQYGLVLENGELRVVYEDEGLFVRYYDFKLPLAPESYIQPLEAALERWREAGNPGQAEELQRVEEIIGELRDLPRRRRTDPEARQERNRQKELIKRQLAALHDESSAFRRALSQALASLNGRKGDPRSFDALDALLGEQSYRLAFWRVAAEEINYRRFFDINDLAAVRVEDPHVFQATHALLLVLIRLGAVSGVRIDHPDGLRDPAQHLWRLQRSCFIDMNVDRVREMLGGEIERADLERTLGEVFDSRLVSHDSLLPLYMVVEKILAVNEQLPEDWPVHGTTGYEFLNLLNGIFVDRSARPAMDGIYSRFTGLTGRYADLSNSTRKMVMLVSLPGEINGLAYRLKRLALRDRRHRDFTLNALTFAVREFIAALPVYRTYIDPDSGRISDADRAVIEQTTREAKRRNPRTDPTIFEYIRSQMLGIDTVEEAEAERLQFVARFQQVSGPVMAKGVEDTAFYQYNRLVSLNEVGGEPDQFGVSLAGFHRANARRAQTWPYSLLATSTHDSKRSEDVRARINVISELPRQWRAAVNRWHRLNAHHKPLVDGRLAPDRNEEYLLYQTLLGVWPLEELDDRGQAELRERVTAFMLKAAKEAKVNTSWINPSAAYEEALTQFVAAVLDWSAPSAFLDDFMLFERTVAEAGMFNSLSQTLLKLASPGVADVYQGNEVWDFSLVDPDNRRPVDYKLRRQLLAEVERRSSNGDRAGFASELLKTRVDGRIKLYVTRTCLEARRTCPEAFLGGGYQPLRSTGGRSAHVCAFARTSPGDAIVAVAPVLVGSLLRNAAEPVGEAVWGSTRLIVPSQVGSRFRNLFTDQILETEQSGRRASLPLSSVLADFPVALLARA